jgi:hypothetical protein
MKDLDFDELDKAVNSLMSKTESSSETSRGQAAVNSPAQSSPVSSSVSTSVSVSTPSRTPAASLGASVQPAASTLDRPISKPSVTPQSLSQPLSAPRPTVPAKRSGRFMDLVPSSYASQNPTKSPAPAPRQGTTLTPLNDNVVAEKPIVAPVPETSSQPNREFSRPAPERSLSALTVSNPVNAPATHDDMPDPLDVHAEEIKGEVDTVATPNVTAAPDTTPNIPVDPVAPVDQFTSTSPFLSDAKVDKRPLGVSTLGALSSSLPPDTTTQTSSQPLPAELHTDLLEIESDNPVKPQPEKMSAAEPQEKTELTPPISIAQQYRQQPRSGDQSHAPVYDTAAHPVTHPAKKKSNILIIVVIALIIVIGGGGVAALFYLGYI